MRIKVVCCVLACLLYVRAKSHSLFANLECGNEPEASRRRGCAEAMRLSKSGVRRFPLSQAISASARRKFMEPFNG
jgi:hypothetical protein